MSNFYGGKQGFSFFIAKTYIIEQTASGYKEVDSEEESSSTIEDFLALKFNEDTDVHYNDYILLSVGVAGFNFAATDNHHGNLYRKDITNFKLIGNLAGPPGGASQVIPLDWNNFEESYEKDKDKDGLTPPDKGSTLIAANVVDGGAIDETTGKFKYNKILFKYYSYRNPDKTTTLKMAIQIPAPYIDFTDSYEPDETGAPPIVERIIEENNDNYFYNKYKYPLVTKYYKPRIENDELYGDLYKYQKNNDNENYSYQPTDKSIYLGKIKQESGILIGQNIAYYILASEANTQTDEDLAEYLINKDKRDTLKTEPTDSYILLVNKKVICQKLNDDFPCGLGYTYASETDHSKRIVSNVDLVGKIITYGDSTGPVSNEKVLNWFFAYDFSRENDVETGNIIPNWYYLSLYSVETRIIFSEDYKDDSNNIIGPNTSEEIKVGDLWIGIEDAPSVDEV